MLDEVSQKSCRKDQNGQDQKRRNSAASKHATSRANSKQEQDQVVVARQKDGTDGSPEQSTCDPARRTTIEGRPRNRWDSGG